MDLWLFVKAVAKHWWTSLSYAAFTILGVYALYFSRTNDWLVRGSLHLAGFLLLASCYHAWSDEHEKSPDSRRSHTGRARLSPVHSEFRYLFSG
jgi:hypothetical protein